MQWPSVKLSPIENCFPKHNVCTANNVALIRFIPKNDLPLSGHFLALTAVFRKALTTVLTSFVALVLLRRETVYLTDPVYLFCSVSCSAASLGFIQATLEPHMRDFNLSPLYIGSMFVFSGATYGEQTFRQFSQKLHAFIHLTNLRDFCSNMGLHL